MLFSIICKATSKSEIVIRNGIEYTKFNVEERITMRNGKKGIIHHVVYQYDRHEYLPGDTMWITNGQLLVDDENKPFVLCSHTIAIRPSETSKTA